MKRSWTIKVIKRIYGVCQWGRYWANIASRRYTRDISIDGNLSSLGENVCIFSLVSRKGRILKSTFYLIEAIKKQGYSFIIVANGQKIERDWLEGAIAGSDLIINRPNLGRDFAAYQLATNLLLGGRHPIRRLLYCNDSVFYLDRNDSQQIFSATHYV
jgi:hypothetical protein